MSQDDRIEMEPVKATLIDGHENVEVFHPKVSNEVPAYLQKAAEKEIKRMLDGGLLEEAPGYSEHVSRFFLFKKEENQEKK